MWFHWLDNEIVRTRGERPSDRRQVVCGADHQDRDSWTARIPERANEVDATPARELNQHRVRVPFIEGGQRFARGGTSPERQRGVFEREDCVVCLLAGRRDEEYFARR